MLRRAGQRADGVDRAAFVSGTRADAWAARCDKHGLFRLHWLNRAGDLVRGRNQKANSYKMHELDAWHVWETTQQGTDLSKKMLERLPVR